MPLNLPVLASEKASLRFDYVRLKKDRGLRKKLDGIPVMSIGLAASPTTFVELQFAPVSSALNISETHRGALNIPLIVSPTHPISDRCRFRSDVRW